MPAVCFRVEAPTSEWDRLVGELHALGVLGLEERDSETPPVLLAYFSSGAASDAVKALASSGVRVQGPLDVPDLDWNARWRAGLAPRQVAGLWIRPSWCEARGSPELVIDPEQAFGTGEHASTRNALRLLLAELRPGDSVLDFGTGSGILGLAALRCGAARVVALDRDPIACRNARANARRNGLGLALACGTSHALRPLARFDLVVANLLTGELEGELPALAHAAGRALILAGYLASERPRLERALAAVELETLREELEEQGGELWGGRVAVAHARPRQSSSSASSVSSKQ